MRARVAALEARVKQLEAKTQSTDTELQRTAAQLRAAHVKRQRDHERHATLVTELEQRGVVLAGLLSRFCKQFIDEEARMRCMLRRVLHVQPESSVGTEEDTHLHGG